REPFAVLLPDELTIDSPTCIAQLAAAHDKTGGNVVAVMDVPRGQTKNYGIAAVKAEQDGLAEGASEDDIKAAHRRLIQRMHPDVGGSADLAARINRAKDVLLGG
ncbi:MAG TPA: hypothetical protein VF949_21670, partial [Reyranella sp.]